MSATRPDTTPGRERAGRQNNAPRSSGTLGCVFSLAVVFASGCHCVARASFKQLINQKAIDWRIIGRKVFSNTLIAYLISPIHSNSAAFLKEHSS